MKKWILGGAVLLVLIVGGFYFVLDRSIRKQGLGPKGDRVSINWYHGAENLKPVIDVFTKRTGIAVEVIDSYDIYNTDVMLISDVGTLIHAKKNGFLSYMRTPERDAVIAPEFRDRDGMWYGALLRARTVVYAKDRVDPAELTSWEDLTDPKWKGRLCLRMSSNIYNRSLVAMMLKDWGAERTENWIKGMIANLKNGPNHNYEGDTGNMAKVANGACDITVMNTYYIGYSAMGRFTEDLVAPAQKVGVKWFDDEFGTPLNVTGIGINPGSRYRAEAEVLVDFLLGEEGQSLLTDHVFKYPVRADVSPSDWLQSYGDFKRHKADLNDLEVYYSQAVKLMEENGWKRTAYDKLLRSLAQERQRLEPVNPVLYP